MEVEERISLLEKSVIGLQSTMESIEKTITRIETSISKLTEVSSNLAKVIAVQQKTLEHDESQVKKNENNITDLNLRCERCRDDVRNDIKTSFESLSSQVAQNRLTNSQDYSKLSLRLSKVERYIWLMVGGGFALGYIVTEIAPVILAWINHLKDT